MLFHASPVNQIRQERGDSAVNGVWFWGVGELPEANNTSHWNAVFATEPLAQGLALHNGLNICGLSYSAEKYLGSMENGATLFVHDPVVPTNVESLLNTLEQDWFEPLLGALKRREITSVSLQFADGREWQITYRGIYRFWKLRKTVA